MKWLVIETMKEEIYSACKSASRNDDLLSDTTHTLLFLIFSFMHVKQIVY